MSLDRVDIELQAGSEVEVTNLENPHPVAFSAAAVENNDYNG